MAICGMCNGKGSVRQETTVEGVRRMSEVMCPRCGGWVELEGRFIDEESGSVSRKKGGSYVDRASTSQGGYAWPSQISIGKKSRQIRLNRRQGR
jgi:DnaJ-class molecular chaperone